MVGQSPPFRRRSPSDCTKYRLTNLLDPEPRAPGEEPVVTALRIASLDVKAKEAGGLYVALKGVLVRPNDKVDAAKEYGLVPLSQE